MNRKYQSWTDEEEKIITDAEGRLTCRQIAERLPGRSTKDVRAHANAMGITLKKEGLYHNRPWTEAQIARVRELAKTTDLTSTKIAEVITAEFGVERTGPSVRMAASKARFSLKTGENL